MEATTEDARVLFLIDKLNTPEAQLESYRSLMVSLENEIARLKESATRYEKLRRLKPNEYQRLVTKNIKQDIPFDTLVDELP